MTSNTFEVDGRVLSYEVHGAGSVCVVHSGGPGIFWDYMRSPELEQHLTMVYLEPAGTGRSDRLATHPHGYTRAQYSSDVAALIEHLDVPRVHLLGHSHGGFVAQYHALHHPEQLAGIVLYDSAPLNGPEFGAELSKGLQVVAERHAGKPGLDAAIAALQASANTEDDETHTRIAREILPLYLADYWADVPRWQAAQAAIRANYVSTLDESGEPDVFDDREALGALELPTLIVVGRHDFICGTHWAEELFKAIPGAQLTVLEDSGHFGHLEEPDRFADRIAAFAAASG
jgi:proline iminopeptidase